MNRYVSIFCVVLISSVWGNSALRAQSTNFSTEEYALTALFNETNRFATDAQNTANNTKIIALFDSVLKIPSSFHYAFADLPIGNVYAPDKSFRVFTWNVIRSNGTYTNYGLLQKYDKATNTVKVFQLTDNSRNIKNAQTAECKPAQWFGATYYDIVQVKSKGTTVYTLMGWSPNTTFTQKKLIETLKFLPDGAPLFGVPILELKGKGFQRRLIFEYSSKNTMMLRYDVQKKMIVLDHLAPSDFQFANIPEFYGPDFSIDGYKFEKEKWRYKADIDFHAPRKGLVDYLPQKMRHKIMEKRRAKTMPKPTATAQIAKKTSAIKK
ncbi:MAG: hypothetical protein LBU90_07335 [Bacteroidales bacterium]|jgi:hypothetical protein|nr:hypothetical protein [Bacteroidales bacterium]